MLRDNTTFTPELLTSIGAGLLSGNTWNQQLANAGLGASTAIQQQKQLADASQIKNKTVQMLQAQNPDLANAVASGIMTPQEAYATHIKQQQQTVPVRFKALADSTVADPNARFGELIDQV